MSNLGFRLCAFNAALAVALLAGCGGSQTPIGAPGAMQQTPVASQAVRPPEGSGPFLYVGGNKVSMFALASSRRSSTRLRSEEIGAPTGLSLAACSRIRARVKVPRLRHRHALRSCRRSNV